MCILHKDVCMAVQIAASYGIIETNPDGYNGKGVQNMADYRSTGKELRKSPKGLIAALFTLAILGAGGWGVYRISQGMEPVKAESSSEAEISVPEQTVVSEPEERILYSSLSVFASDAARGPLMLINRDHAANDAEEGIVQVYAKKGEHFGLKDVSIKLLEETLTALNAMTDAYYQDLHEDGFLITGGYRTKEEQRKIYTQALADDKQEAVMAGFSDYESGYSVSFVLTTSKGYLTPDNPDAGASGEWLKQHAAEYGFVPRCPADKTEQTGFSGDSSHYRYVGVPHAVYMTEHNLCLEEYLALLAERTYQGEHLPLSDGRGKSYEAYFYPLEGDSGTMELPVPSALPYTVSGTNRGGFVVTVELQ